MALVSGFDDAEATKSSTGVFITAESLTFPTAAAVCAALVGGLRIFFGDAGKAGWVLAVCVVVGGIIILLGWPKKDSEDKAASLRRSVAYAAIGILNTFLLFISVIGIITVSTQAVPGL